MIFSRRHVLPVKKLLRDVFKDSVMSKFINQTYISLKTTSDEYNDYNNIKKKYNVRGLPTVIFFDRNGNEIDRNCGYDGEKDKYFQTIQDYAANKNTLQKLIDNYKADSLNVENNFKLAMKYLNRWEMEKGDQYFRNVLQLDPENHYGFKEQSSLNIAIMKYQKGQNISSLQSFMKSNPESKFLWILYGYLLDHYQNIKDTTNFLKTSERAIEQFPEKDVAYWRLLNYYNTRDDTSKILKTFQIVVTNLPEDPGYLNWYAWTIYEYRLKHLYNKAIKMARRAVDLESESDEIWDTLGWLYYESGDTDKAIKAMETAAKLSPEIKSYQENLDKFKSQ